MAISLTHGNCSIVAVTGLAGHAFGSWAHSAQRMWLRDYLPWDIQNRARILIYGYESQLHGANTATSIISDYGNSFTQGLMDLRDHPSVRSFFSLFLSSLSIIITLTNIIISAGIGPLS